MTTTSGTKVPKAAAIYVRISSDRSGEGLGVERQEQLCRELAKERGWTVAEVYEDNDRSAYSGKPRLAYERMLADIEAGIRDAVVCVDLDRLTRRPAELETFMELADHRSIALANVSGDTDLSSSDGRFKARIMGAVARQESERKGERVRREAEQAAQRGVPRGSHRPFGYEADRITIRESEAEVIREAADRVLAGVSVSSIARDWNGRQIPTTKGARGGWTATTVAGILRNPRVTGLRVYRGEIVAEGTWDPILDRATFERLAATLKRKARPGREPKQLLSAIARCGSCGGPLWTSHKTDCGRRVLRYACIKRPGSLGCGTIGIVGAPLDRLITDAVIQRLSSKEMAQALTPKSKKPNVDVDLAQLERDLEDLAADFGAGTIPRREWLAARKPLEQRLEKARRALDTTNGTAVLAPFRTGDVQAIWDGLDVDRRRVVLEALIDRIMIAPAPKPGRFDTDRIDVVWRA